MAGAKQIRYDELFALLSGDFRRNYAPHHAFADCAAMFQTLPGLIGFWPGSAVGTAGLLNDLSGNGLQMTNNNNADFSANTSSLIPWLEFDGVNQYFSRADAAILDITGTEAYIASAINGLTVGGWFWFDSVSSTTYGLISKYLSPNDWGYRLRKRTSNLIHFEVSTNGTAAVGILSGDAPAVTAGAWFFCVGRYIPSSELSVFVNNVETISGSAPPASVFVGTADLEIGRTDGAAYLDGRASLCFLCAAALPDVHLTTLYEWSRPLFNR